MHTFADKDYDKKYGMVSPDQQERIEEMLFRTIRKPKMLHNVMSRLEEIQNIKWHSISFCIYTDPKATPRPRINNFTKELLITVSNSRSGWIPLITHSFPPRSSFNVTRMRKLLNL